MDQASWRIWKSAETKAKVNFSSLYCRRGKICLFDGKSRQGDKLFDLYIYTPRLWRNGGPSPRRTCTTSRRTWWAGWSPARSSGWCWTLRSGKGDSPAPFGPAVYLYSRARSLFRPGIDFVLYSLCQKIYIFHPLTTSRMLFRSVPVFSLPNCIHLTFLLTIFLLSTFSFICHSLWGGGVLPSPFFGDKFVTLCLGAKFVL